MTDENTTPSPIEGQAPNSNLATFALPLAILIAGVMISGTILYTSGKSPQGSVVANPVAPQPPAQDVEIDILKGDNILGDKDARVTIVEFSDMQCPFCRSFWSGAYPQIKSEYIDTGKARLVWKHLPLNFHPAAGVSATALECAGEQGSFWELHDKIFEEQAKQGNGTITYGQEDIEKWAGDIGLSASALSTCIDSGKYESKVAQDASYASEIGVTGTPTLFVNGRRIVGAQPFAVFKSEIEKHL